MRTLFFAAAAFGLALPAAAPAQPPRGADIEAMAPAIDRATDALLDLDVGPLIDAADPYRRRPVRHRTLRQIAREDDPYFEQRLRGQIYGSAAGMARMMDAFAAAEPGIRRSMGEIEREIDIAIERAAPDCDDEDWDYDPEED
jgi:hypothetical protein